MPVLQPMLIEPISARVTAWLGRKKAFLPNEPNEGLKTLCRTHSFLRWLSKHTFLRRLGEGRDNHAM